MNWKLLTAALLAALTAIVHIVLGGEDTAKPLLSTNMDTTVKMTLYAVWHLVSVFLSLSAIVLFISSLPRFTLRADYLVWFITVLWGLCGMVFLIIAAAQPGEGWLLKLPQWILLFPVGLLGLWHGLTPSNKINRH